MERTKRQKAVDSSGNEVEVMTIGQASKFLEIKPDHLKLQLFKCRTIPFYKVIGRSGKRLIRIRKADLDKFVVDTRLYDRVADKIREGLKDHVQMVKGISQAQMAKELGITKVYMNYVINKKARLGIKKLNKLAEILGKDLSWFIE
jgi:predicted XRE-type DNA-binding protein